jgi:hypothetical protein
MLDNRLTLDYVLAKQEGMYVLAKSFHYPYVNTSSQVEKKIDKIM